MFTTLIYALWPLAAGCHTLILFIYYLHRPAAPSSCMGSHVSWACDGSMWVHKIRALSA